ncbi:MAG: SufD family Fe-S cluster assembly protein [bacterium]|nr:SufD family Fe-S cluster assembly protein [bacterium]
MNKIILTNNKSTVTINKNSTNTIIYQNSKRLLLNVEKNITTNIIIITNNELHKVNNTINIKENSNVCFKIFYNNKQTIDNTTINLLEKLSTINYHLSAISHINSNITININHLSHNTKSNIINNVVNLANATTNIIINSYLPVNTNNCYLNQKSVIITNKRSTNSIKPNMYINNNQVTAKHGSVIAPINNNQLLYLMSKSLSKEESIRLIINGILLSHLQLPDKQKQKIQDTIIKCCFNNKLQI